MRLCTLQQARERIRSDTCADDADVLLAIDAASSLIVEHITASIWEPERDANGKPLLDSNGDEIPMQDSSGQQTVRYVLQMACALVVAEMVRERDGSKEYAVPTQWGHGYTFSQGVNSLLYALRSPTLV